MNTNTNTDTNAMTLEQVEEKISQLLDRLEDWELADSNRSIFGTFVHCKLPIEINAKTSEVMTSIHLKPEGQVYAKCLCVKNTAINEKAMSVWHRLLAVERAQKNNEFCEEFTKLVSAA